MSMFLSLLMLLAAQDAPAPAPTPAAQDDLVTHGVWKGQCWLTGIKSGPVCRFVAGRAGKMWIMIERHQDRMDIFASGTCGDGDPETLPQSLLAGPNRVAALRTAIDLVVLKTNTSCKSKEAFPNSAEDIAALLAATDAIAGTAAK